MNHSTISVWAGTLIVCIILVFGLYQARGWVGGVREQLEQVVQDNKLLLEGLDELLVRTEQLERVGQAESPPRAPRTEKPAGAENGLAENLSTRYKIYYRTKDGEDLAEISERFGVSESELRLWNALKPTDSLIPGQVVVINKSTNSEKTTVVAHTSRPPDTDASMVKRKKAPAKERGTREYRSVRKAQAQKGREEAPAGGTVLDQTGSDQGAGKSMAAEKEQTTTESTDAGAAGEPVRDSLDEPVEEIVHTVQAGETLSEIGQEYGISWQLLAVQNQITRPETLYEGQRIKIRMDPAGSTAGATHEISHTVRAGENLYRIGLRYGIPWEEIAHKNNISKATRLRKGQVLKIPTAKGGPELPP